MSEPRMRKLLQVGERIWIVPPQWEHVEPTIGFVITENGVIAIDSGNSPDHARRALAALRAVTDLPIRYVINSHRHWDHTFGNHVFVAPVIAHEFCKRKMLANMRDDWAPQKLTGWVSRWVLKMVPTLRIEQFEGLKLVLPQITFTGRLELSLGETVVRLLYAGGGHTRDSIIVHVPSEKILFLSDALYPNPEGKIIKLAALFEKIEHLGAEKFISGHEMPYGREQFALRAEYYRSLVQIASKLRFRKDALKEITRVSLEPRYAQINRLTEKKHHKLLEQVFHELPSP